MRLNGKTVTVNGLPLIFEQLFQLGVTPDNGHADRLLSRCASTTRSRTDEEAGYRDALAPAYAAYYHGRTKTAATVGEVSATGN